MKGQAARECAVDEAQFGQRFAAPVKPGVESRAPRDLRRPRLGDEHAVGLNRAVDPGAVTEDRGPRGPEPRCLALGKRFGAIATEFQQALRPAHILGREELVVPERDVDRALEDLYIDQDQPRPRVRASAEGLDRRREFLGGLLQTRPARGIDLETGRRHRAHVAHVVVLRPVAARVLRC